jgi:RNA polymerase sigma-70 factor (ECF subfamily)
VNKSIHELPPKCRIVYKMVKENGLSYKEVGEILNISPRTVENHIAAAIKKLASLLDADFPLPRKSFTLPGIKN